MNALRSFAGAIAGVNNCLEAVGSLGSSSETMGTWKNKVVSGGIYSSGRFSKDAKGFHRAWTIFVKAFIMRYSKSKGFGKPFP